MNGDVPLPLEEMPLEIRKHLSVCDCSCDHMGFGNYQVSFISNFLHKKTATQSECYQGIVYHSDSDTDSIIYLATDNGNTKTPFL